MRGITFFKDLALDIHDALHEKTDLKGTCNPLGKNSPNQQLLDILTCNSGNKPSFKNPTKSLFAQRSIDVKSAVTF